MLLIYLKPNLYKYEYDFHFNMLDLDTAYLLFAGTYHHLDLRFT